MHVHDSIEGVAQRKRRRPVGVENDTEQIAGRGLEVQVEVGSDHLDAISGAEQADQIPMQIRGSTARDGKQFDGLVVDGHALVLNRA